MDSTTTDAKDPTAGAEVWTTKTKIINDHRKNHVDIFLVCSDKVAKVKARYGVEKSILANASIVFSDMFDLGKSNQQKEEELEWNETGATVTLHFLQVLSFVKDPVKLMPDQYLEVLRLGKKFCIEPVTIDGLRGFCFTLLDDFTSAYNLESKKGELRAFKDQYITLVSLWRQGIEKILPYPSDVRHLYKEVFFQIYDE